VYNYTAPNGLHDGGIYYLRNKRSGKYVSIENSSINNEANIQQWEKEFSPHFRFKLSYLGNNLYSLKPISNLDLAMDVEGGSLLPGANVRQYTWNNTSAQKWLITINTDSTYTISPQCATYNALSVVSPYLENGNNIASNYNTYADEQKWYFEETTNSNIAITNYYDDSMNIRWNATNSQLEQAISSYSNCAGQAKL